MDRNGNITLYEVEYIQTMLSDEAVYNTTVVDSLTFMLEVTDLEEYTEYFVRVRAFTSVGPGPYSGTVMGRTDEDGNKYTACVHCTLICFHSYLQSLLLLHIMWQLLMYLQPLFLWHGMKFLP